MKFKKGDKVCALLVCNKWGVDFMCYVGELQKIEQVQGRNPVAQINVDSYYDLKIKHRHAPTVTRVDVKLFKLLPWTHEVKLKIQDLRDQSRKLNKMTRELKDTK